MTLIPSSRERSYTMKKTVAWLLAVLLLCSLPGVTALAAGNEICGTWYLVDLDDGTGEDYANRTLPFRIREQLCRLFSPLL